MTADAQPGTSSASGKQVLPRRLANYLLLVRLGSGGMAEVHLAKHLGMAGFQKLVVVKSILEAFSDQDHFIQMFLDEARLAAHFNHPNIVQIFDLGQADERYFIAMEYVNGEDLRHVYRAMRRRGQIGIPLPILCQIFSDLLSALHYAHEYVDERGRKLHLVHRDVSPQNILVSFGGFVKLVDFGVAKAQTEHRRQKTEVKVVKGKFSYLSPEQAKGKELDNRSDLYSAGICMWELATSERLFRRETDLGTLNATLEEEAPPPSEHNPSIPRALDEVILKALHKDRDRRYSSALAFKRAIDGFARQAGFTASSMDVAQYMRELFADKLATRAGLMRQAQVESFEELLLDENTHVLDGSDLSQILDVEERGPESASNEAFRRIDTGTDAALRPPRPVTKTVTTVGGIQRKVALVVGAVLGLGLSAAVLWLGILPNLGQEPAEDRSSRATRAAAAAPESPVRKMAKLSVVSDPPGAQILVDGEDTGKVTPSDVSVPLDTPVALRLLKDGYLPWTGTAVGEKDDAGEVRAELATEGAALGAIKVTLNVPASVYLDGRKVSTGRETTTLHGVDPSTPHTVLMEAEGYEPATVEVEVEARRTSDLIVDLEPVTPKTSAPVAVKGPAIRPGGGKAPGKGKKPPPVTAGKLARLMIDASPYATVLLDGRKLGDTPINENVRPGKHKLVLKGPGGKSKTVNLDLKAGERFAKRYSLE